MVVHINDISAIAPIVDVLGRRGFVTHSPTTVALEAHRDAMATARDLGLGSRPGEVAQKLRDAGHARRVRNSARANGSIAHLDRALPRDLAGACPQRADAVQGIALQVDPQQHATHTASKGSSCGMPSTAGAPVVEASTSALVDRLAAQVEQRISGIEASHAARLDRIGERLEEMRSCIEASSTAQRGRIRLQVENSICGIAPLMASRCGRIATQVDERFFCVEASIWVVAASTTGQADRIATQIEELGARIEASLAARLDRVGERVGAMRSYVEAPCGSDRVACACMAVGPGPPSRRWLDARGT